MKKRLLIFLSAVLLVGTNSILPFAWQQEGANSNKKAMQARGDNKNQADATDRIKDELRKFSNKVYEDQEFWEVRSKTGKNFIFTGKLPKEIQNTVLTRENVQQLLPNQIRKDQYVIHSPLIKLFFKNMLTVQTFVENNQEPSPQQQLIIEETQELFEKLLANFLNARLLSLGVEERAILFSRGVWAEANLFFNIMKANRLIASKEETFSLIKNKLSKKLDFFTQQIEPIYKFIDAHNDTFFSQVFNQPILSKMDDQSEALFLLKIMLNKIQTNLKSLSENFLKLKDILNSYKKRHESVPSAVQSLASNSLQIGLIMKLLSNLQDSTQIASVFQEQETNIVEQIYRFFHTLETSIKRINATMHAYEENYQKNQIAPLGILIAIANMINQDKTLSEEIATMQLTTNKLCEKFSNFENSLNLQSNEKAMLNRSVDRFLLLEKIQKNDFGFKKASKTTNSSDDVKAYEIIFDDTTAHAILFIEMLHALDNKLQELLKENKPAEEDEPAVVAEPTHLQNQTTSSEKQKTELPAAVESKSKAKRKKTTLSATTSESEFSTSAIRAKKRTPLFTGEDDLAGFGNKQKAKNLIKQSIKLASNIKTWLSGSNKILDKRNLDAHTDKGQDEIRRHTIDLASLLDLNKLAVMIKDAKSDAELVNKLTKEFGIAVVSTAKTQNFVKASDVSTLVDLINKHPNDKLLFLYIPCIVQVKDSTDESETSKSQLPEPGALELIFNIKDPSAPVCFHNYFIPKTSLITSEKYLLNANLKSYFTSFFLQVEKEQETSIEAIENWVNFLQDTKEKNPTEWVSLSINDDEYGLIYNSSNQDRYKWVFCKFNFSPA